MWLAGYTFPTHRQARVSRGGYMEKDLKSVLRSSIFAVETLYKQYTAEYTCKRREYTAEYSARI
jgi:hypothetical protein